VLCSLERWGRDCPPKGDFGCPRGSVEKELFDFCPVWRGIESGCSVGGLITMGWIPHFAWHIA